VLGHENALAAHARMPPAAAHAPSRRRAGPPTATARTHRCGRAASHREPEQNVLTLEIVAHTSSPRPARRHGLTIISSLHFNMTAMRQSLTEDGCFMGTKQNEPCSFSRDRYDRGYRRFEPGAPRTRMPCRKMD
jgi:hypothetical protein